MNQTSEVDLPPYVDYLASFSQPPKATVGQDTRVTGAGESSAKEPEVRLVLRIQPPAATGSSSSAGGAGGGKEAPAAAVGCVLMDDDKFTIFKYAQSLALQSAQHSLQNRWPTPTATSTCEGGAHEVPTASPSSFDFLTAPAAVSAEPFNTNSAYFKSVGDTLKSIWDINFMCDSQNLFIFPNSVYIIGGIRIMITRKV